VKGHDIPLGADFNDYIKEKIQNPKLVILLMTPAYMESSFCLMELGAAWAQGAQSLAIVVPPVPFSDVAKTLGLKQAWKIDDKSGLVGFRKLVKEAVPNLEQRTEYTWDEKRLLWTVNLKRVLKKLAESTKVDAAVHRVVVAERDDKAAEIEDLERALATAQERYTALEKLKDKAEVKALVKASAGSAALDAEFQGLIAAVEAARPSCAKAVFMHIIMDHFGKSGSIDWSNDKSEFEAAVKYSLIDPDDGSVLWGRSKLIPLGKALDAVQSFLASEEGDELRQLQDSGIPMDPDDLEFWEHHL
jgi:hypothetical protein